MGRIPRDMVSTLLGAALAAGLAHEVAQEGAVEAQGRGVPGGRLGGVFVAQVGVSEGADGRRRRGIGRSVPGFWPRPSRAISRASQLPERGGAVVVGVGVVGVETHGVGEVLHGGHLLLEVDVGEAAVVVGLGVVGVETENLVEVADGEDGFHKLAVEDAAAVVCAGVGGVFLR